MIDYNVLYVFVGMLAQVIVKYSDPLEIVWRFGE